MTFNELVSSYLPEKGKLSKEERSRLKTTKDVDKIRKINKHLPLDYYTNTSNA